MRKAQPITPYRPTKRMCLESESKSESTNQSTEGRARDTTSRVEAGRRRGGSTGGGRRTGARVGARGGGAGAGRSRAGAGARAGGGGAAGRGGGRGALGLGGGGGAGTAGHGGERRGSGGGTSGARAGAGAGSRSGTRAGAGAGAGAGGRGIGARGPGGGSRGTGGSGGTRLLTESGSGGTGSERSRGGRGLAAQVEQGSGVGLGVSDTEAGGSTSIVENVPPGVGVTEERASDLIPELLGVGNAGNSLALGITLNGPTGLGDPNLLIASGSLEVVDTSLEQTLGIIDGVGLCVLEVRVSVETEPVDSLDGSGVGAVGPGVPGIDVTDGGIAQAGTGDGGADLVDVVDQLGGLETGTGGGASADGGVTVEILGTDGDTDDQVGEVVTVGVDGGLESGKLVGHGAAGGPETEEKSGLLLDSSGDGLDGAVGGATLDHSVETGTGEGIVGANEVLGGGELGLEVGLRLDAAVTLSGTVVETLRDSLRGSNGHSQSEEVSGTHFECETKKGKYVAKVG